MSHSCQTIHKNGTGTIGGIEGDVSLEGKVRGNVVFDTRLRNHIIAVSTGLSLVGHGMWIPLSGNQVISTVRVPHHHVSVHMQKALNNLLGRVPRPCKVPV